MRRLAEARGGGPAIVAGESGAAGLAGFLATAGELTCREALGLDRASRVLVIGTEGATDPEVYRRITGLSPEQVDSGHSVSLDLLRAGCLAPARPAYGSVLSILPKVAWPPGPVAEYETTLPSSSVKRITIPGFMRKRQAPWSSGG